MKILQWISPEPYIKHHQQVKEDVLAGTGKWLLLDPVFSSWQSDSISSLLWLHGMIGSGKSKLTCVLLGERLLRSRLIAIGLL